MVKIGDNIVCIDNSDSADSNSTYLTIGKVYNVRYIIDNNATMSGKFIYRVINDKGIISGYYDWRFISLAESKKLKLERLRVL